MTGLDTANPFEEDLREITQILKIVSNKYRFLILDTLFNHGPARYVELAEQVGFNIRGVGRKRGGLFAYHVRKLKKYNLIELNKKQNYEISDLGEVLYSHISSMLERSETEDPYADSLRNKSNLNRTIENLNKLKQDIDSTISLLSSSSSLDESYHLPQQNPLDKELNPPRSFLPIQVMELGKSYSIEELRGRIESAYGQNMDTNVIENVLRVYVRNGYAKNTKQNFTGKWELVSKPEKPLSIYDGKIKINR